METEKKKRGRPPKIYTAETTDMTYEGLINYNLNKQVKSELDKSLANKPESQLTDAFQRTCIIRCVIRVCGCCGVFQNA